VDSTISPPGNRRSERRPGSIRLNSAGALAQQEAITEGPSSAIRLSAAGRARVSFPERDKKGWPQRFTLMSLLTSPALVAQWIEQWLPKPRAEVRLLPGGTFAVRVGASGDER
jgi:hypothetical protein